MSTVTGSGHYGEWISAHLDGELSRAQDARLQVHLLQCAACAEALAAEQEARSLLLAATEAEPSAALTQRLLALACQDEAGQDGQPAGRERHGAGAAAGRRQRPAELRTLRPGGSPTFPALTGDLRARRSVVAAVVVGAVGLGLGAGGLAALGAPPRVVPSAHRAEALTTLARTVGSGRVATAGLGGNVGVAGLVINKDDGTGEAAAFAKAVKQGRNVLAVSAVNAVGGSYIDLGLDSITER